jgi:hypothetical protein
MEQFAKLLLPLRTAAFQDAESYIEAVLIERKIPMRIAGGTLIRMKCIDVTKHTTKLECDVKGHIATV